MNTGIRITHPKVGVQKPSGLAEWASWVRLLPGPENRTRSVALLWLGPQELLEPGTL